MSIWCTEAMIGYPDHDWGDTDADQRGRVLSYATGWSNHYPDPDEGPERPARVDLNTIPPWCVPGHQETTSSADYPVCAPWLRLDIDSWQHDWHSGGRKILGPQNVSIILDEDAARALAEELTEWLARPKVHPGEVQRPAP